jgi:hypothetical protein
VADYPFDALEARVCCESRRRRRRRDAGERLELTDGYELSCRPVVIPDPGAECLLSCSDKSGSVSRLGRNSAGLSCRPLRSDPILLLPGLNAVTSACCC